jgi:hypothetical protein
LLSGQIVGITFLAEAPNLVGFAWPISRSAAPALSPPGCLTLCDVILPFVITAWAAIQTRRPRLHERLAVAMGCSSQLRFHESRLIGTAHGTPARLSQPTVPRCGPATMKVPRSGVRRSVRCLNSFRTSTLGNCFRCEQGFHNGIECSAAWPGEVLG